MGLDGITRGQVVGKVQFDYDSLNLFSRPLWFLFLARILGILLHKQKYSTTM